MADFNRKVVGIDVDVNTKINKKGIDDLLRQLQALKNLTGQDLINVGTAENLNQANSKLKEIKESAMQIEAALNKSFNFTLGTTDLTKLNNELNKLDWAKIIKDFNNAGAMGKNAFRSVTTEVLTTNLQLKESHKLLKAMGQTMANTIKWGISSSVMNAFVGSVEKAYSFVKDLDTSLNDIRIVTNKSAEEMNRFAVAANKSARALAASTRDYTEAALIYYQQGLSDEEVEARTNITIKTANVTKQSTEEVSEQLTAVWNGYNVTVQESEAYIDKLAAVAASTAADLEELSVGMSKVASSANAMGVPIDQLNAQLATIISVTRQAPESVGTALRTIYARMGDIEAGLDTETTLGSYTAEMKELGVNVLDADGNLRDMGDVITEVGNNWSKMSREQQIALAQTMAGTRQYNNLLALFENWDMYNEALETSKDSLGTLQEQQDIYLQSTEAHLQTLKASMERIYSDLIDTDALNDIVDAFSNGAKGIANYIEAIGGAKSAFSQLGAIALKVLKKDISTNLTSMISNFGIAKNNAKQLNAEIQIMQKFKGIKVDDDNFKTLVAAKNVFIELEDAMTETQRAQANALLEQRNEIANEKAIWDEKANAAEKFYNIVMDGENQLNIKNVSLLGSPEEIEENFNAIIDRFTTTPKVIQGEMASIYESFDADYLQTYIDTANDAINIGLVKDEKNINRMKKIISEIENMPLDKEGQLSDEQIQKLKDFEEYYLKFSNEIKGLSKETLKSIMESAMGMADQYENALQSVDAKIVDFIKRVQTQNIVEGLTEITSSIFMINSMISSIRQLPRIWNDEDITTGEKILQTLMSFGNIANGVFQTFKLINTAADTVRNAYTLQSIAVVANSKAVDENTTSVSKNIKNFDEYAVKQEKVVQPQTFKTGVAIGYQTSMIDKNSEAILINTDTIAERIKLGKQLTVGTIKKSSVQDLYDNTPNRIGLQNNTGTLVTKRSGPEAGQESGISYWLEGVDNWFKEHKDNDLKKVISSHSKENHDYVNIGKALASGEGQLLLPEKTGEAADAIQKISKAFQQMNSGGSGKGGKYTFLDNIKLLMVGDGTSKFKGLLGLVTSHPLITAAIAAIGTSIWYLSEKAQEAEKEISRLEDAQKKFAEQAENLSSEVEGLKSAFDSYNSVLNQLSACEKGTAEWYKALRSVNSEMLSILEKYPDLAEMPNLFQTIDGTQVLNTQVVEDYIAKTEEAAINAQLSSIATQTLVSKKRNELAQEDLEKRRNFLASQGATNYAVNNVQGFIPKDQRTVFEDNIPSEIYDKYGDFLDNLSEMSEGDIERILKETNASDEYIESIKEYKKEVDKLGEETEKTAIQMQNAAKIIGASLGDKANDDSLTDLLQGHEYQKVFEERQDYWENKMTGWGINKFSGSKNDIYQEVLEQLNQIEGYEDYQATANAVRGTDFNRQLAFFDPDSKETVVLDAEYLASILATGDARKKIEDKSADISDSAKNIKESLRNVFDDDQIIDAIFSRDYAGLTQEQMDEIASKINSKAFRDSITKDMLTAAGAESWEDFDEMLKKWIAGYDAEDAAQLLEDKLKQIYRTAESALGEDEGVIETFAEMLKNQIGDLDFSEEELAEFAKECFEQQKAMESLSDAFVNNKDVLEEWANSTYDSTSISAAAARAVNSLKVQINGLFGNKVYLDSDFIKENFELIRSVIDGDIDALDELESKVNDEYLFSLGINDLELWDDYEGIKNAFDQLNNTDLEFGAYFNDEEALASLQRFFEQAKLSEAEAQQVLDNFGYDGQLEEVKTGESQGYTSWNPVTTVTQKTYKIKGYTAYGPQGNAIKVPSYEYPYPELNTTYEPIEKPAESGPSFWVLRSKNGESTSKKVQKTGLVGSVKSKGTASARKQAIQSYGGSSSASSSKSKYVKPVDDEADRYHSVDTQITKIENKLSKLQSTQDKLFGADLLKNLDEQWVELNNQVGNYNEKLKIAYDEQDELKNQLVNQGVTFNADGTIANYLDAFQTQENYVNSLIDQYNHLSEAEKEAWDEAETIDKAQTQFDEFKENMDRYDELISDFIPQLEQNIRDAVDQQVELQIQEFKYEIDIRLDLSEAEREWNEFKKRIIDGIKDDDILGNARARLLDFSTYYNNAETGAVQGLTDQINKTLDQLRQQDITGTSDVYGEERQRALEDLKNYYDQLSDNLNDVLDLQEEIHQDYLDMLDEAQEKFDEQIDQYETIRDLIEHDMNVIELVYGEEAYGQLSKYYERQEENYNKQLEFQRMQKDFWYEQMQIMEENSDEWESAKEKWLAAVDEWNAAVEEAIRNLQDKYLNAINEVFQNLNNQATNGKGLDYIEEEWELINKNAEQYLDTIDATWGIQQLENKYMDAYDQTESIQARRQIKKIMDEELGILREQDKLTQYDIDRANMRYNIMLKQIALQEAQQNKSQMRLRRDSQGNYRYEFIADDDEIGQLQDELGDLYTSLYDFDKEHYLDTLNNIYDLWVEFQEKMTEAAQINDPQARAEKELLLRQQYEPLLNGVLEENLDIRGNLNQSAFDDLAYLYKQDAEKFRNMTEEEKQAYLKELIPQMESGVKELADYVYGKGGFIPAVQEALDNLDQKTQEYEDGIVELQEQAGQSFGDIGNNIDDIIEKNQTLLQENKDLIQTQKDQVTAIQEVVAEIDNLVERYNNAFNAATNAMDAAHDYFTEIGNEAADAGEYIDSMRSRLEDLTSYLRQTKQTVEKLEIATSAGSGSSTSSGSGSGSGGNNYVTAGSDTSSSSSSESANGDTKLVGQYGSIPYGDYNVLKVNNAGTAAGMWPQGTGYSLGKLMGVKIVNYKAGSPYPFQVAYADTFNRKWVNLGWVKKDSLSKISTFNPMPFKSGGYTGDWSNNDGRLALLHQKELVLNATDTQNILNAVNIMRNLSGAMLDKLAAVTANSNTGLLDNTLEQNVHIEANFPNVQSSHEIEDAINNLMNVASQRINRRGL